LELANTQYYGWAFQNRALLLPTREQIGKATEIANAAKRRHAQKMDILFVAPDYYGERPKPCMNGWGRQFLTVNPMGDVLPCPTAGEIKELRFDNIRTRTLEWIWASSEAFNRFRGTEWMPEPCRGCEFRELDFGGCRCQAALITGQAEATDPACSLSPHREKLAAFIGTVQTTNSAGWGAGRGDAEILYRQNPS
jgi:pyrroloquinoline quinone biosynthesis protein E